MNSSDSNHSFCWPESDFQHATAAATAAVSGTVCSGVRYTLSSLNHLAVSIHRCFITLPSHIYYSKASRSVTQGISAGLSIYFHTRTCVIQDKHFQLLSDSGCSTGSTRAATCQEMVTTPSCTTRSGRRDRLVHRLELWGSKDRMETSELRFSYCLPSTADTQQCSKPEQIGLLHASPVKYLQNFRMRSRH